MTRWRSVLARTGLALVALMLSAVIRSPAAAADPAGPTDYRATVRAVEPSVTGLEVRVVGGDAFLWLRNGTGRLVEVDGYEGEPYLRFHADGVVEENRASPTAALNRDRLPAAAADGAAGADGATGAGALPALEGSGRPAAPPRWVSVSTDGSYAWHDHRAHWMSPVAPLGRVPGDEILDATVPIEVDGAPVEVRVSVVWERRPPLVVTVAVAAGIAAGLVLGARRWGWAAIASPALLVAALAAGAVGGWEQRSLPAGVAPSPLRLLAPLLAASAALLAWRRARWRAQLALLAASQLLTWGWLRRTALYKAVLPTEAPIWLDRSATALALVVGAALGGWAAAVLLRVPRPEPGHPPNAPPATARSEGPTAT